MSNFWHFLVVGFIFLLHIVRFKIFRLNKKQAYLCKFCWTPFVSLNLTLINFILIVLYMFILTVKPEFWHWARIILLIRFILKICISTSSYSFIRFSFCTSYILFCLFKFYVVQTWFYLQIPSRSWIYARISCNTLTKFSQWWAVLTH